MSVETTQITHTHTHARTYASTYACINTCMHTHTCTCTCTHVNKKGRGCWAEAHFWKNQSLVYIWGLIFLLKDTSFPQWATKLICFTSKMSDYISYHVWPHWSRSHCSAQQIDVHCFDTWSTTKNTCLIFLSLFMFECVCEQRNPVTVWRGTSEKGDGIEKRSNCHLHWQTAQWPTQALYGGRKFTS